VRRAPGPPVWIVGVGLVATFVVGTVLVRGWAGLAAWGFLLLFVAGLAVRGRLTWPRRRA
jgi:hypothetical protein